MSAAPPDIRAVSELIMRWAWLLDHDRCLEIVDLLTEDAVVTGLGPARHGRQGMRDWAVARAARLDRKTHHQLTNIVVHPGDGVSGGEVLESTTALVLRVVDADHTEPYVDFVGEYRDRCVRTPVGWRFARRAIVPLALTPRR